MTEHTEILADFRALPLPVRMREAIAVLQEANKRLGHHLGSPLCPAELLSWAANWEAEDAQTAAHEAMVEELANLLKLQALHSLGWHERARKLVAAGWTRVRDE